MRRSVLAVAVLLSTTTVCWAGDWTAPQSVITYPDSGYEFRVDVYYYVNGLPCFHGSFDYDGPFGGQYGYYDWTRLEHTVNVPVYATTVSGEVMRKATGGSWVDHTQGSHDIVYDP